jgi:phytoene synthase
MRETKPTIWPAVAETISAYRIPRDYFLDLIDRQIEDLAVRCRPNFESLYSYCYGVASTVGMMCVTVWGNRSERALVLAEKRGIAMQLTNILRDFLEDHGRGRVYLPIDDFERFGLTPVDLAHWSRPSVCEAMVQFQVARAESYFQESDALESILEPRCARTSWIMMRLYRTMLDRIQREPNRIVRPETIRLSTPRKIAIVAHSFLRGRNREP